MLFSSAQFSLRFEMTFKSVEIYTEALDLMSKSGSAATILNAISYTMVTIYCCIEFAEDLEKLVFCLVTYGFGVQVSRL